MPLTVGTKDNVLWRVEIAVAAAPVVECNLPGWVLLLCPVQPGRGEDADIICRALYVAPHYFCLVGVGEDILLRELDVLDEIVHRDITRVV